MAVTTRRALPGLPHRNPAGWLRHHWAAILVALVALVAYGQTLLPGMAFDDWGEMQTVPRVLGIAHPTGYPTYILASWAFGLLPIGSEAFRANLLSALCVALALAVSVSIQRRLGVRPVVAAAAALATGAVATVWSAAVVAEVNGLHLLLIALILDRALAWADERRLRDLALGGLLVGLSMGNHVLTAFVVPFVALHVLWSGRETFLAHPRWVAVPVLAMAAGALVYLYVPIAAAFDPPLRYNDPDTLRGFLFLVTGEQFRGQYGALLSAEGLQAFAAGLQDLWRLAAERASPALPVLGFAGFVVAGERRPAWALVLAAIGVTGAYIWANYLRLEHYLLVPWLVTGILAGVALDAVAGWLERAVRERGGLRGATGLAATGTAAVSVAGLALAAGIALENLPEVDRSGDRSAEVYADSVLGALPPDAAILTFWGASPPLWHAIHVQGRRPDVLVIDDSNIVYEGWGTREHRIDTLICQRPVFIIRLTDRDLESTSAVYRLTEVFRVRVSWGGPVASHERPIHRVEVPPGRCG